MACRFEKINDQWLTTCDGSSEEGWDAARQSADLAEGTRMNDEAAVADLSGLPGVLLDRFEDSVGLAPKWKTAITRAPDMQYAQAGLGLNEEGIRALVNFIDMAQSELTEVVAMQPDTKMSENACAALTELNSIKLNLERILKSGARSSADAVTFMRTVYQADGRFSYYLNTIVNRNVLREMKDNGPEFRQAVRESAEVFRLFSKSYRAAFPPAPTAVVGASASQAPLMRQLLTSLCQMEGEFQSMPPGWKVAMLVGLSITTGAVTYCLADKD